MNDSNADGGSSGSSGAGSRRAESSEFQQAVDKLEAAVHELLDSAKGQFSDRATAFIEETTRTLEREFGRSAGSERSEGGTRRHHHRHRSRHRRIDNGIPSRSRRLYRDPERAKIGGVCAGIARYYGIETWVVRCAAVTGLIFVPQIVFLAYWIAYFVMGLPPRESAPGNEWQSRDDHSSPAPELGAKLSPRRSLRNIQADLTQIELKLRRMETHVVSGQYELQKELNKIDEGGRG
jgi:phage shock protein C